MPGSAMSFLALLNWRLWAAGALALTLVGTHWKSYTSGKKTVQTEWNAEKLSIAEQSFRLSEQATRVTADLQANSDNLRKTKNAQIARLNTDLAAALAGLSDRPARRGEGDVPSDTTVGAGCTGASLYADDAAAFIREAARADRLRLDLGQCQQAYQAARDALK